MWQFLNGIKFRCFQSYISMANGLVGIAFYLQEILRHTFMSPTIADFRVWSCTDIGENRCS